MAETLQFKVGDRVRMTKDVYEEGEDLPPGRIAAKGDIVFIRRAIAQCDRHYAVGHEHVDGSFWVDDDEIEAVEDADAGAGNCDGTGREDGAGS